MPEVAHSAVKPPPMFNAPLIAVAVPALLVLLHALVVFAPPEDQNRIWEAYALEPQRFWAPAGSELVYADYPSGLVTLLSSALLHIGWDHVLVNALMLVAVGAPVGRALGSNAMGWAYWMLLFVGSILGGSALYLLLSDPTAPGVVGASGGVSGMMAAAFLLDPWGGKRSLLSRPFLGFTLAFGIANLVLVLAGPVLFGQGISWQSHVGGYVAGALIMAVLPVRSPHIVRA